MPFYYVSQEIWLSNSKKLNCIDHKTIIRKEIKSLVICATQLAGGLLLEILKYFEVKNF